MDVVTTSLEALIQRVTNPQNPQKPDIAAIEAFCVTILKETEGIHIASKLLATHIVESTSEWEALQALSLLDTCMRRCGGLFHAEVGKFRFLNEMIKLVSPKYLGNSTPVAVREKVLELLYAWTVDYPREIKIKEAFEMLKKQGVVKEELLQSTNAIIDGTKAGKSKSQIFEDEEKSKLLQKLLQSKNPDDYQAANKLIKTMVKEDEKRLQQNSRRIMELESVHSNARLLSDMLNSYTPGQANTEDLELMKELHDACGRLKPIILRLANEIQDNEDMLKEVLAANDELDQVFDKYATTLVLNRSTTETSSNTNITNNSSLLDLSAPNEIISTNNNSTNNENECNNLPPQTDMDILGDIFNSLGTNSSSLPETPPLLPALSMQPINIAASNKTVESVTIKPKGDSKTKALDDLNELGESLLKESLSSVTIKGSFNNASKETSRLPMNSLKKLSTFSNSMQTNNCNIAKEMEKSLESELKLKKESEGKCEITSHDVPMLLNGDDSFDNAESHFLNNKITNKDEEEKKEKEDNDIPLLSVNNEIEIKSLADISVSLENITPGTIPPLTVIDEKNGITVVLHFAKDSPRPADVSVIVVTTMSKNSKPLSNYLFQAVVPKKCKCRLQPPSGTELPAHNPFLPPSAITQIALIANPCKETLSLKFMLSYTMDGETITEMGDVDRLPIV
ncbi:ADP-ribosylation factor-binding protein GGA3 [Leptopilina boulardi]|uniref:ADP-ribosylation factor-binding protein GGA3 n=1 Tax=Leptopilina boulardi TaxID=63433 RepID=UPI0021F62248|nr:ADP-ribosylation factor-binding protein GGA3 [Leptopilina boulardi]